MQETSLTGSVIMGLRGFVMFISTSATVGNNRQYGVNFTYRFGKQQGVTRRRSSATEDEQNRVGAGN